MTDSAFHQNNYKFESAMDPLVSPLIYTSTWWTFFHVKILHFNNFSVHSLYTVNLPKILSNYSYYLLCNATLKNRPKLSLSDYDKRVQANVK